MNEQNIIQNIDITEILRLLPHRYPFILVDRVLDVTLGEKITAIKNVTINEPFFQGHFPSFPVMPGVLIVEAMAQVAGILTVLSFGERKENEMYFFAGIDKARFKKQVVPGDQITFEVTLLKTARGVGKFHAVAKVDGQIVAEAEVMTARKEIN